MILMDEKDRTKVRKSLKEAQKNGQSHNHKRLKAEDSLKVQAGIKENSR